MVFALFYTVRKQGNHYYLILVEYLGRGKKKQTVVGNCEWLRELAERERARLRKRPYYVPKLEDRGWSRRRDLNPRPPAYEAGALPG